MIVYMTNAVRWLHWRGSAMASPGGKLSSVARLMRNGEMDQFCMQFVKKVQFERLCVYICLYPISENVAVPHPPLRGTFPPGGRYWPANLQFHDQLIKADSLNWNLQREARASYNIVI